MSSPTEASTGGAGFGHRLDVDREADEYGPGAGGKKRKVPAFPQSCGRNEEEVVGSQKEPLGPRLILRRLTRSPAARAASFRKTLFLRRKAALITLYLDAQAAKIGSKSILPVAAFEKLLPMLEYVGVSEWAPDRTGWRNNWESEESAGGTGNKRKLERWKSGFAKRMKVRQTRVPVVRGGWAPEGSFELDCNAQASSTIRTRTKDISALQRLVVDLRAVVLSSVKPTVTTDAPPSRTRRKVQEAPVDRAAVAETPNTSPDGSEANAPLGKKKPKKKKRGVLANMGNPHHVDNYRPTRTVSPHADPFEPWSHHNSLLFPPPMRFLSARPQRKTAPLPGQASAPTTVRPAEDDYICCFCEFALFFGSEASRKKAIRARRQKLKRKDSIKAKAKGVTEGRNKLDEDEEEDGCDEDGYGKCT
ncbi:hypothetical protein P7C73_g5770, partial [Tremellales sp. Uapishka_1]